MKKSLILLVLVLCCVSIASAKKMVEKEVLFYNGSVKGVFAKGELQNGKATVYFSKLGFLFEGEYEDATTTKSGLNFRGTLTYEGEKYECFANLINNLGGYDSNTWVKSIYAKGAQKRKIGIEYIHIAEYKPAAKFVLVDKIISKENVAVEWRYSKYENPIGVLLDGKHSIYYKNGNVYTGVKGDLSQEVEYVWANGDKFVGYVSDSEVNIEEKVHSSYGAHAGSYSASAINVENVNKILATDQFPHYITRSGCFKLKDGREIKIATLYDVFDCESKEKVYSASKLSGEGKTPSEIVSIRDSVALAQAAKKQRIEEEKKRLEEEKKRQEEEKKRQEEEKRQTLIRKYGEANAALIVKGEIAIGMTKEMVLESLQSKKKIYDITYEHNKEFWKANRNQAKKYIQYEMAKTKEEVLAGMFVGAMIQSMGLSEDYMKALFKYYYLEFKDNVLVGFREWQDAGSSYGSDYSDAMSIFGAMSLFGL